VAARLGVVALGKLASVAACLGSVARGLGCSLGKPSTVRCIACYWRFKFNAKSFAILFYEFIVVMSC